MSKFEVKVIHIDAIESIPGADAIELAKVADYRSVVRKGDFTAGDLAIYIPEQSVLPEWLLKKMGLEGKLAGSAKNRVRAIRLRGALSQGLLYKVENDGKNYIEGKLKDCGLFDGHEMIYVEEGQDIAQELEIIKYEPVIPASMSGEVCNIGSENTIKFDVENIKKYPNIFKEGEEVWASEKAHGTFCGIGYVPGLDHDELFENGDVFTFSKGLGAQGLVFKNNEKNTGNVYVQNLKELTKNDSWVARLSQTKQDIQKPIFVLGEIFGRGIQDLDYGFANKQFRVFDVYIGKYGEGRYLNFNELLSFCNLADLEMVDIIYQGKFNKEVIEKHSTGSTITGEAVHMREGIVIKPLEERHDNEIGRVLLKSINPDYLLRKGNATEYN